MKTSHLLCCSMLSLGLVLTSCMESVESAFEKQVRQDDEAIHGYLRENNIEAEKLSSGVYMVPLKENKEGKKVQEGHVANILYTMRLLNNETLIENYADTLHPLQFSHTANALVPAGLNYGLTQMREGEKARFYLPAYQAFGDYQHQGLFDAHANMIVDVHLLKLQTEEEVHGQEMDSIQAYIQRKELNADAYPNGLYYKKIKEGQGKAADKGTWVKFHFTRKYLDGTVIETTKGKEPLHVGFHENKLVKGLELGLKLMNEGEEATIIMPSKLAFGKSLQVIPQTVRENWVKEDRMALKVKPYTPVIYELELLEVN